jgi:tRNA(Arg) A34 adenosine deaminase TadA
MPFSLTLPDWLLEIVQGEPVLPAEEERLRWVIELSRRNVMERTGGPFSAGIFQVESGRLVAAGVSRVEPLSCSIAHAEVMAIVFAEQRLGRFDLGARELPAHELVSSAQPCVMCTGATLWSGVLKLAYAARKTDVEELLGFDEGPLAPDWQKALRARGLEVAESSESERALAREVLTLYRESGGLVYNSRQALGIAGQAW